MTYTTVAEVSAELGGVTLDASSTPTSTVVDGWIADIDSEINQLTNRVWESTTVTSSDYEYYDYGGNGRVITVHAPIISVESVEFDTEGLGAASTAWSSLTEGRTDAEGFIVYKEEGLLQLHSTEGSSVKYGLQNVRLTYTHGYATTPLHIKRLSTLMTAQRYISSVASNTASEGGGSVSVGTISVSDPNNYVHNHLSSINAEIKEILKSGIVPTARTYEFNNNIYD